MRLKWWLITALCTASAPCWAAEEAKLAQSVSGKALNYTQRQDSLGIGLRFASF